MCDFIFHLGSIHRLGDITEKHPVYSLISPNLFEDISGCQNITPNPMLFIFPNLCNLKCNSIEFAISKNSQFFFYLQPEMIWHRFPNPQLLFIGNLKSALNLKFREAFTISPVSLDLDNCSFTTDETSFRCATPHCPNLATFSSSPISLLSIGNLKSALNLKFREALQH